MDWSNINFEPNLDRAWANLDQPLGGPTFGFEASSKVEFVEFFWQNIRNEVVPRKKISSL